MPIHPTRNINLAHEIFTAALLAIVCLFGPNNSLRFEGILFTTSQKVSLALINV